MPQGKNYRPLPKQMLNGPGNFCRAGQKSGSWQAKGAGGGRFRRRPERQQVRRYNSILLPVLLDSGGTQTGQAMALDGPLPAQKFLNRQRVTAAGVVEA